MKRLLAAASLIGKCGIIADIGCDHGYISRYALENSLADGVWACDISAPSLEKAKSLLQGYENARFFLSDGFKELPYKPDTAVILGMGGHEITKIISDGKCADTLILGPHNNAYTLRKALFSQGYEIEKDFCVCERGKYYDIIKARKTERKDPSEALSEEKLSWGTFCDEKDPTLKERLEKEEIKLAGYKQTENNAEKLRVVREVLKWQR